MTHEKLHKQYNAELEANPEAWKNWQVASGNGWINLIDTPVWDSSEYRRKPNAPPFPPVDGRAAMQAEALAEMGVDYPLKDGIPPTKRHQYAAEIIAAANGEQMQSNVLGDGFVDCCKEHALINLIQHDYGNPSLIRIKPKTHTVVDAGTSEADEDDPWLSGDDMMGASG